MSDIDDLSVVVVLLFLSTILVMKPLLIHIRLPIIGWPRITIDLGTALMFVIILPWVTQFIGASQVCDGSIDDIRNLLISLAFMAITLDGENNARKLYLYFYSHFAIIITLLLPRPPSHRQKPKRRRREKKGVGMEMNPEEEKSDSSTPLLKVDYQKKLGFGSLGTVVYGGLFQGRAVAVKCLPHNLVAQANHEISILKQSDDHPNVIRYYYYRTSLLHSTEIVLDLCPASLADIIEGLHDDKSGNWSGREDEWRAIVRGFNAKKAMKQIASGLKHLHGLGLVHQDIEPQNILISCSPSLRGKYRMLISDFRLCQKLDVDQSSFSPTTNGAMAAGTAGWRAPEMLVHLDEKFDELPAGDDPTSSRRSEAIITSGAITKPRLTKSVDIFVLGCLFHYILTQGEHPFGDPIYREANIIKDDKNLSLLRSNEAYDLITRMLHPQPSKRPDIETCLLHPFFWDAVIRLGFLRDASDRFEVMSKDPPMDKALIRLERDAKIIVGNDWRRTLDPSSDQIFIRDLRKSRRYDGSSVRDLLRVLRNKKNHYQDLPDDVKSQLGPMPEGFLKYFTCRYPKLLIHVHEVVQDVGLHHESTFKSYFELLES